MKITRKFLWKRTKTHYYYGPTTFTYLIFFERQWEWLTWGWEYKGVIYTDETNAQLANLMDLHGADHVKDIESNSYLQKIIDDRFKN